ncbi:MAG: D-alanyl-D-alanine carboxypeptidase [Verrucomicrobiales bacterium]|nr:D-alanyl-D-alanine carboxypeptidase [Verrucomicrobiales bacterium]
MKFQASTVPFFRFRRQIGGVFFVFNLLWLVTGCQTAQQVSHVVSSNPPVSAIGGENPVEEAKPEPPQNPVTIGQSPQNSGKPGLPTITAKAALLVDHRGRILYEKNSEMRLPTASTQKLLLGILICDSGNLDETVTVMASDTNCEPTKMGIQPGQTYRKGDLLKAVLVRSSNDLARCLARHHSGSVSAFAHAMNVRARQLGMHNSYFTNASGLPTPAGQYSTAKDLAILANAAMRRPAIREAVGTKAMVFRFSNGTTKTVYNTNQVLKGNPYCIGCKTGYTHAAGRCLVSSASDGRRTVIAVVLGSKSPNVWSESDALLRYGLGH